MTPAINMQLDVSPSLPWTVLPISVLHAAIPVSLAGHRGSGWGCGGRCGSRRSSSRRRSGATGAATAGAAGAGAAGVAAATVV